MVGTGVIETKKTTKKMVLVSDDNASRCVHISEKLKKIIDDHGIQGVVGELPHGGSQNARASHQMGLAIGAVSTTCHLMYMPTEWCTPQAVKKAITGKIDASKKEIIDAICKLYGIVCTEKKILITKGKRAGKISVQKTYHILGAKYPESKFEHIADSIGVYMALSTDNLVKMFG